MAENKAHDARVSVAKALCIILMVVGHSGAPALVHDTIYLFHMPCFFLLSGFFFTEKNLEQPWHFVKRRAAGLWWPFVKFSLIFLALHNLFAELHLYGTSYSWGDIAEKAWRYSIMSGSEQLLGGYWFLKELFLAALMVLAAMWVMRFAFCKSLNIKSGGGIAMYDIPRLGLHPEHNPF